MQAYAIVYIGRVGKIMRKRLISVCIIGILVCGIYGYGQSEEEVSPISEPIVDIESIDEEILTSPPVETEDEISSFRESVQPEVEKRQWHVYIQPDMPEPFIEVLNLYEEFINSDIPETNNDDAWNELWDEFHTGGGKWWYLSDEFCGTLMSLLKDPVKEGEEEAFRYSLTDLTGDGFPELIMGYYSDLFDEDYLYAVYYYSETEGIKMEWHTSYFSMSLYEGGIIEYISGGMDYTITYLRFQEETESWELADCIIVDWNSQDDSESYYRGVNTAHFADPANEPMSEEEYREIVERYTAEPVELEWIPLFGGEESADGYFFPQGESSHTYMATFIDLELVEKEVVLHVTEVQAFEEGTLYELKIDSDMEARDTHAGYRGDWRNFGLFYVQGDEIYFIRAEEAQSEYQTVEEILDAATIVCSEDGKEDTLDEDERGWHEFILAEGDRREYHGYSTMVETGYYEHFYWEKGKGLVTYESGYGALADGIEMHLVEIP